MKMLLLPRFATPRHRKKHASIKHRIYGDGRNLVCICVCARGAPGGSRSLQGAPGRSCPPSGSCLIAAELQKMQLCRPAWRFFRPLPQSSCRVAAELQKIQLCLVCTGLVCLCVRGLCVCGLCVCVEGVCVPGPFRLVLDGGSWGLLRGRGPDSGPRLL